MIDINDIENFLWEYFGKSLAVIGNNNPESEMLLEREGVYNIQDLAPALADFLHERGVDVDWTDRSRYGDKETQK